MSQDARLILELEDEIIFTRRSATIGDHETLDYIPGSTLLGWAAGHLYKEFSREESYLFFHSGKVRFYNGLPLTSGCNRAKPMPLCWHEDKAGQPAREKSRLISNRIFNLIHPKPQEVLQPRQLRGGYVDDDGLFFQPSRIYRMKTALDPETATAAESQLFGYESLVRGQQFVAGISADDDVSSVLFQKLLDVFKGCIRIGRSRSAQYGRVMVRIERKKMDNTNPVPTNPTNQLTLWLISDLALRDRFGSPTLFPDPSTLGLPKGHLDLAKTFLRFRSYAPYNAFLKSRGMERQVLMAGSVLTFIFDENLQNSSLSSLSDGIGFYREHGLGEVSINPKLLEGYHPVFSSKDSIFSTKHVARPDDPLIRFLERRVAGRSLEKDSKDWAEKKVIELSLMYRSAREFNGVKSSEPFGPSRAQWRRVSDAVNGQDIAGLEKCLFDQNTGVCKEKDEEWGIKINTGKTFLSWLKDTIKESENEKRATSRNIQWLAKLAEDLGDQS